MQKEQQQPVHQMVKRILLTQQFKMQLYGQGNWGDAVAASTVTLEPGLWSLSNFGQVLVATIANGETFTWDSSIATNFTTRASKTTTNF